MKIICIGRNYRDHALELNNPIPKEPLFFLKPSSSICYDDLPWRMPDISQDIHYECEIVYRIGKDIEPNSSDIWNYIDAITLGIDFTARDIQKTLKEKGHPWEKAKAFDRAALLGRFIPFDSAIHRHKVQFELLKNDTLVQSGNSDQMIFSLPEIVSYISRYISLEKGDLIFTGTPKGVGLVSSGDRFESKLLEEVIFRLDIA